MVLICLRSRAAQVRVHWMIVSEGSSGGSVQKLNDSGVNVMIVSQKFIRFWINCVRVSIE